MVASQIGGEARAWPPTFGTEFNFTSAGLESAWNERGVKANWSGSSWQVPGKAERDAATEFAKQVVGLCGGDCVSTAHRGKFGHTEYLIKFKDGWGFNISMDPGMVEIQTEPETAGVVQANAERYQKYVFEAAEKAGLAPHRPPGGSTQDVAAHLNVGFRSAFGDDPRKFMRFFIDYANQPALALGVFGKDPYNSPTIPHLDISQRKALAAIVADVNAGKFETADQVMKRINSEVYTVSPSFPTAGARSARHYQALGLKQLLTPEYARHDMPFEFRAIRQQLKAREYALLVDLMQRRLEFTNASTQPIRYEADQTHNLRPDSTELAQSFRRYVSEMGLKWEAYEEILLPEVRGLSIKLRGMNGFARIELQHLIFSERTRPCPTKGSLSPV